MSGLYGPQPPQDPAFKLHQQIHDTHWELHDLGYALKRGLADADDVKHTAGMLRTLARLLDEHAEGMSR